MIHKIKDSRGRGFTLVELLAVIVILAIILVIAVPKVMSVIEDAKKATLESTAKMIASQAEKQKVQNTVLGNNKIITCKDITNINDVDYEDCDVAFDNNTAKVTITGSGKFEGLHICNGTKTSAVAQTEECTSTSVVTGASYLEGLLENEETLNNGLVQTNAEYNGTTYDAGIRYVGALSDVKNQVYFNCESTDGTNTYGSENYDYANNCEIWRIIGVFDVSNGTTTEKRVKIINIASTFQASWDSSAENVNSGIGINQWGEVKDANGNITYAGADLMQLLNGYYISAPESICTYCNGRYQSTCQETCTTESLKSANMKVLTSTALSMIDEAVWDTYAVKYPSSGSFYSNVASELYLEEKGINAQYTGKSECENIGGYVCNDTVVRTTNWIGLVALMSVSDVRYANRWLYYNYPWLITPFATSSSAGDVWGETSEYHGHSTYQAFDIHPVVYLKSNVQIIDGNGNDKPYILK